MSLVRLYDFPFPALVDKPLSKAIIFEQIKAGRKIKDLFTKQVEQITWWYKLAPETIHLPPHHHVLEFQIIRITCRVKDIDEEIFRSIDRCIPSPVVFSLQFGAEERYVGAFKRPNEADSSKVVVGQYFKGSWFPSGGNKQPLPIALNIESLYHEILRSLIPIAPRERESVIDQIGRAERIELLQREADRLRKRLQSANQFNRKVELNREIQGIDDDIFKLSN